MKAIFWMLLAMLAAFVLFFAADKSLAAMYIFACCSVFGMITYLEFKQ